MVGLAALASTVPDGKDDLLSGSSSDSSSSASPQLWWLLSHTRGEDPLGVAAYHHPHHT